MSIGLFVNPRQYYTDAAGNPLSGYKLFTYKPGTTTEKTAYSDADELSAHSNPIVLDSAGSCTLYLTENESYRIVIKDPTETTTLYDVDPVINHAEISVTTQIDDVTEYTFEYVLVDCDVSTEASTPLNINPNGEGNTLVTRPELKTIKLEGDAGVVFHGDRGMDAGSDSPHLKFVKDSNAVNYIQITYTANDVTIEPVGDDADIDLVIDASASNTPMYLANQLFPTSDGSNGEYLFFNASSMGWSS